jgi:CHAT domain-containing protein
MTADHAKIPSRPMPSLGNGADMESFFQESFRYVQQVAFHLHDLTDTVLLKLITRSCSYALRSRDLDRDEAARAIVTYVEALATFRVGELLRSAHELSRSAELFRASEKRFLCTKRYNDRIRSAFGRINCYVRLGEISHDPSKLRLALALYRNLNAEPSGDGSLAIGEQVGNICAIAIGLMRLGEYVGDADLPREAIEMLRPWVGRPELDERISAKVKLDYVAALSILAQQSSHASDYEHALAIVNSYVGLSKPSELTAKLHFWKATLLRHLGYIRKEALFLRKSADIYLTLTDYFRSSGQENLAASAWHGRAAALVSFYGLVKLDQVFAEAELALVAAGEFYTSKRNLADWLRIQSDIAELYSMKALHANRNDLHQLVIDKYVAALDAVTSGNSPSIFVYIAGQLFLFQCRVGRWADAASTFEKMLAAQEFSLKDPRLGASVYLQTIKEIRRDFASAAWCLCKLGDLRRAIEILDFFRARELVLRLQSGKAGIQLTPMPIVTAQRSGAPQRLSAMFAVETDEATADAEAQGISGRTVDWVEYISELRRTGRPPSASLRNLDDLLKELGEVGAIVYIIFSELGAYSVILHVATKCLHAIPIDENNYAKLIEVMRKFSPDTGAPSDTKLLFYKDLRRIIKEGRFDRRLRQDGLVECSEDYNKLNDQLLDSLRVLWTSLLAPIDEVLSRLNLVRPELVMFCPPGPLSRSPFLSAVSPDGFAFAHKWTTSVVPSLFVGAQSCAKIRGLDQADRTTLIITNPRAERKSLGFLRYAEIEARRIRKIIGANTIHLTGRDAEKVKIIEHLPKAKIFHVSCHGEYQFNSPGSSWIEAAHDGTITIESLRRTSGNLPRNRFCFLAACESGIAELGDLEDEFTGLPSGFLGAGAPAVICTLWPMFDDAIMHISTQFYRVLFSEADLGVAGPATALRASISGLGKGVSTRLICGSAIKDRGASVRGRKERSIMVRSKEAAVGDRWENEIERGVLRKLEFCPYEWAGIVLIGI